MPYVHPSRMAQVPGSQEQQQVEPMQSTESVKTENSDAGCQGVTTTVKTQVKAGDVTSKDDVLQTHAAELGQRNPKLFKPSFLVPTTMAVPLTLLEHQRIEKTAQFVIKSGGQAEILLKLKRTGNPEFAFLFDSDPLHEYYTYLKTTGFVHVRSRDSAI